MRPSHRCGRPRPRPSAPHSCLPVSLPGLVLMACALCAHPAAPEPARPHCPCRPGPSLPGGGGGLQPHRPILAQLLALLLLEGSHGGRGGSRGGGSSSSHSSSSRRLSEVRGGPCGVGGEAQTPGRPRAACIPARDTDGWIGEKLFPACGPRSWGSRRGNTGRHPCCGPQTPAWGGAVPLTRWRSRGPRGSPRGCTRPAARSPCWRRPR